MSFYPESIILNKPYIPYYNPPVFKEYAVEDLEIEPSIEGTKIILKKENKLINPFIDFNKYDISTKKWIWYDSNEMPNVVEVSDGSFKFSPIYISEYSSGPYTFDTFDNKVFDSIKNKIKITATNESDETKDFYLFSPILLKSEDDIFEDITNYITKAKSDFSDQDGPNPGYEFYWDFDKTIYTNQNLEVLDNIKLFVYEMPSEVTVKARLSSNDGKESYTTPYIDYFIVNLNGQVL